MDKTIKFVAENTYYSDVFQKKWSVHMQAFGEILKYAFVENYVARIHLCAALDYISRQETRNGHDKLELVHTYCETDKDETAWLFCMGLCYEMDGRKEDMLQFYQQANEHRHDFYLPYLKVAKNAHEDAAFDIAEQNYREAIRCLWQLRDNQQSKIILASAYTNLTSCLTMMHRYSEAEEYLELSKVVLSEQAGRASAEAILYAAMQEKEKLAGSLEQLKKENIALYMVTKEMTDRIMSGEHPHFSKQVINPILYVDFWNWFYKKQENVKAEDIQKKINKIFTFMQRTCEVELVCDSEGRKVIFYDYYVIALHAGYQELIKICPEVLKEKWNFKIEH